MPIDTDNHHDPAFPYDDRNETDEIALPRFEERLRTRLARAHEDHNAVRVADPLTTLTTVAPGMAPSEASDGPPAVVGGAVPHGRPPARRGSQRRRGRRSLLLGVGALAAVAALVAGTAVWPSGGDRGDDATAGAEDPPGSSVPPTSELAPLIIAATDEAEATSVVHVTQDNTSYGDTEGWKDETTGAGRLVSYGDDGEVLLDASQQGDDTVTVDHCFGEYVEGVAGLPPTVGSATEWVQNYLEDGLLVEDGTQVVDGRELIRLRQVPYSELGPDSPIAQRLREARDAAAEALSEARNAAPPVPADELAELEAAAALAVARADALDDVASEDGPGSTDGEVAVTLVDPDTYRPVMVFGFPGSDSAYTQTYEYLPRTPENLARLAAEVPAGFTKVTALRGDGAMVDAGCI